MSLMRKAKGLQRFMLDCGWWRGRNWAGVGLDAIGLQQCAISYCYEHGTDGRLPKEDLALGLGLREKEVKGAVATLLKKGRWIEDEDGYEIVGYQDHNPTQAEIADYRRKKVEAAIAGNHKRHHVDKKTVDPDCPLCLAHATPPSSQVREPPPRSSEGKSSQAGSLSSAVQCSAEESSAVQSEIPSSSSNHQSGSLTSADDDEDSTTTARALALMTDRRIAAAKAAGVMIQSPARYRAAVLRDVMAEFGDDAEDLSYQGRSVSAIADALCPANSPAAQRYPDLGDHRSPLWSEDANGNAVRAG